MVGVHLRLVQTDRDRHNASAPFNAIVIFCSVNIFQPKYPDKHKDQSYN